MKKRLNNIILGVLLVMTSGILMLSCKDTLDVSSDEVLTADKMFTSKSDADAAIKAVYQKLFSIGDRYVVLNELRADLLDVTTNAGESLKAINEHNVTSASDTNSYANPYPYYAIILRCNDILYNLNLLHTQAKLRDYEYNQRFCDIGSLRTWLYFQLAMQYKELPYVTEPLLTVAKLKDSLNYPTISNTKVIDSLVSFMETRVMNVFPGHYTDLLWNVSSGTPYYHSIQGTYVSATWVPKYALMGDLYLWKNEYTKAATCYKSQIDEYGSVGASTNDNFRFNVYRQSSYCPYTDAYTITDSKTNPSNPTEDINSHVHYWRNLFKGDATAFYADGNNYLLSEWLWTIFAENSYTTSNPFINLFSNTHGQYLLKPSQVAIDNWALQVQKNGFEFDTRGDSSSYWITNGQPVVMKYSYDNSLLSSFQKGGKFLLYRAALLQLRYAEAANRDGHPRLAWAILNWGVGDGFNSTNTGLLDPYLIYSDGTKQLNCWDRNMGIRGRAWLKKLTMPATVASTYDSIQYIEEKLVDEGALELAFEGNRWGDLVRVANRRNDPDFLANRIYKKLKSSGNAQASAVHSRLMDESNWYLPFPVKKSVINK